MSTEKKQTSEFWSTVKADVGRFREEGSSLRVVLRGLLSQGFWALFGYRIFRWFLDHHIPTQPFRFVVERTLEMTTGISIPAEARIGKGLRIHHFGGIIIHSDVVIGEECTIYQGVTIGDLGGRGGVPRIGSRVIMGAGARLIGSIEVGDDCEIGANAVVRTSIPSGCLAVGVPAVVKKKKFTTHLDASVNIKQFIPTLILTQNFLPLKGGTVTWMLNTYGRYQSREAVLVTEQCDQGDEVDKALPFPVERIPMKFANWDPTNLSALRGYVDAILNVCKISRQYGVKQIHVARVLPDGLVALLVRWFTRVPYLLYAHGEEIQTHLTSRKFSWLMPKIYNGAAAVIANSTNTKHILENIGIDSDKIHIINPGVSSELFNSSEHAGDSIRQRHKLNNGPVLLTVGRLQRRKGQDMVIKALPEILKVFPTAKYLIVGIGVDEAYLQNLVCECGIADNVVFAGQVSDNELAGYYAACDIFIMPNRRVCAKVS